MKFLHFNFLPLSADLGLLVLRLWLGGLMVWLHGWGKLVNFSARSQSFTDPFGIGSTASLALVVFAEVVCAVLLLAGAYTRAAAAVLAINMLVAFWVGHGHKLTGQGNGELAFIFFGGYVALFLTGAGKLSVDAHIGAKT
jgi:putative oxidoreductase